MILKLQGGRSGTRKMKLSLTAALLITGLLSWTTNPIDWDEVQARKVKYLELCAQHAMEQQKMDEAPPVAITFHEKIQTKGSLTISEANSEKIVVSVDASPFINDEHTESIKILLREPLDFYSRHSGIALTMKAGSETSPEVRVGLRLSTADGRKTEITPVIPALSAWGQAVHELYFDWSLLNYSRAEDAVAVLKAVKNIEVTFGALRRAPERGPSLLKQKATVTLSDLRLVDYHKGSMDPSRRELEFDDATGKWISSGKYDLTLQHRCQEVAGIIAAFGKEKGEVSAVNAMDMAMRTQCWDGSFQDGRRGARTVASGEYTYGFALYALLHGYMQLEKMNSDYLAEIISVGPDRMSRRDFYQRMFYRGALSRTAALPSAYRDDIIGGNTLVNGANRVLGYALAMRMIARELSDPQQKKEVMDKYLPVMREIADAQGKFSGGFPVLGEGDRYKGKGIHYDAGYTRTHMDWLVVGARQTGDPLLVQMLERYQTVFEAVMNEKGLGLLQMISERHQGDSPQRLILPDVTYQVGVKYQLPIIAQWGYNCSQAAWSTENGQGRGNHFVFAATTRGYTLGAHTKVLMDDLEREPRPKDPGYLFPRQFPLWTTRAYTKEAQLQHTSVMNFHPDGSQTTDYRIEVGEYPVTVGVPVMIKSAAKVSAIANELTGWPKLLPAGANIDVSGDVKAKGKVGEPIKLKLKNETRLVITGPDTEIPVEFGGKKIPFKAVFTLTPEKPGQIVEVTILRGTLDYAYAVVK
jgi:hypothetical protein